MRWFGQLIAVVVAGLLLGGCAANDLLLKRQTETESKVEHLFQVAGTVEARLNELNSRLSAIEEKEAAGAKQLRELQEQIAALKTEHQALQTQVSNMAPLVVPKVELVNPEPPTRGKEGGPPAAYVRAFGLYSSNQFSAAIAAFEQFLKESPTSEYVPNAHYWIGECHYSSSQVAKAVLEFQKVVDGWPKHPKAADALLKIGYSQAAQKQQDKAKATFERLIRNYPGSPAAIKARERLMSLDNPA